MSVICKLPLLDSVHDGSFQAKLFSNAVTDISVANSTRLKVIKIVPNGMVLPRIVIHFHIDVVASIAKHWYHQKSVIYSAVT